MNTCIFALVFIVPALVVAVRALILAVVDIVKK